MKIHEASEYLMASSSTSENIARGSLAVTKCLPAPVFLPTIQLQASLLYEAHGRKPQKEIDLKMILSITYMYGTAKVKFF